MSLIPTLAAPLQTSFAKEKLWQTILSSNQVEKELQQVMPSMSAFQRLCVLHAIAPHQFSSSLSSFDFSLLTLSAARRLITAQIGSEFFPPSSSLAAFVRNESEASKPLLLVSAAGFDQSMAVEELVKQQEVKKWRAVAIGAREGFDDAERALDEAATQGGWLLLKNVHLVPQWLVQLEKKLHGNACDRHFVTFFFLALKPHSEFRLLLTAELSTALPHSFLRSVDVLVFEASPGIKSALQQFFADVCGLQLFSSHVLSDTCDAP